MKKKNMKKVFVIFISVLVFLCAIVGGYFLYKYMFPTDKELFVIAHLNTLEYNEEKEEPEKFTNTTNVSFSTEGDFTSQRVAKSFSTISLLLENTKISEDETEYNVSINFLEDSFLTTNAVKSKGIEVFTIPQLSEESYGADSYEDVLAILLGSEKAKDTEVFENIDKEQLEKYFSKYFKEIYNSIPNNSFKSTKENGLRTIELNLDLNRTLYNTLTKIKADTEFRDFLYEQNKIISENINKKYPYAGEIVKVPKKEEFYKNFEKNIDDYIKNNENSKLVATVKIDNNRRITEENISIISDEQERYSVLYSQNEFSYTAYKDSNIMFKYHSVGEKNNNITNKKTDITFDINDFTKEKSEKQKMVTVSIASTTATDVNKTIKLPEKYVDIRNMSKEEKEKLTQKASENFMGLIATITLELLS